MGVTSVCKGRKLGGKQADHAGVRPGPLPVLGRTPGAATATAKGQGYHQGQEAQPGSHGAQDEPDRGARPGRIHGAPCGRGEPDSDR